MKRIALIELVFFFLVFALTVAAYTCPTGQHFVDAQENGKSIVACVCDNQNKIVQNGVCVTPCDTNEWYEFSVGECHLTDCGIGKSNIYHSCMTICSGNESWDTRSNRCTNAHCPAPWLQYIDTNGICTYFECPSGYHWDNFRNTCIDNGCPVGQSRNTSGVCTQQCPAGQHFGIINLAETSQKLCICDNKDKIIQNGTCVMPCDENEYFSSEGKCYAKCSAGTHYQNGVCVTTTCTGGQIIVNGVCKCPTNKHLENGVCVNDPTPCPAGQSYAQGFDENGFPGTFCVCNKDNELVQDGNCVAVCTEEEYFSEGECRLRECGIGRLNVYHACANICNNNESWDLRNSTCNSNSNCNLYQYIDQNGNCIDFSCPTGYHWDNQMVTCIRGACPLGRYRNASGSCTDECPEGKKWNTEKTECIPEIETPNCLEGQHDQNGTCVNDCPAEQHLVNGNCVEDEPSIYPVASLGNCSSQSDCETYCNVPAHVGACLDFAEANGLMSSDELVTARKMLQYILAGTTPGKCTSKQACNDYCDKKENLQECINFAVQIGEISQQEADMALRTGGVGPGGCKREQCQTYCNDESHFTECIDFAVANGLIDPKEAEMARKTGGKGPAGCKREECETYCKEPAHQKECFDFAVANGLIEQGNVEMMTECMKGPKECDSYCKQSDEKFNECIKMWETSENGPSQEELRRMKINYFESPGNCKGEQSCVEAYCKAGIPEHSIACEQFQLKIGEKTQEQFNQWQEQFNANQNTGPTTGPQNKPGCPDIQPKVLECTSNNSDPIIETGSDGCLVVARCEPKKNCPQGEHWENGGCITDNQQPPENNPSGCEIEAPSCNAGPPVCVNNHWECTALNGGDQTGSDQGFHCGPNEHLENGACVSSNAPITGQVIAASTNFIDSILKLFNLK